MHKNATAKARGRQRDLLVHAKVLGQLVEGAGRDLVVPRDELLAHRTEAGAHALFHGVHGEPRE